MLRSAFSTMNECLPYFTRGEVIKGFGRGSKQLGIPTANFPEDVVNKLPAAFTTGVYYGWAKVDDGSVEKMVMSVGWNPYYKNMKKSMNLGFDDSHHVNYEARAPMVHTINGTLILAITFVEALIFRFKKVLFHFQNLPIPFQETHILHSFKEDFYGSVLSVAILGYIREERGFSSLDELIKAIKSDIAEANRQLEKPEHKSFMTDNFFQDQINSS